MVDETGGDAEAPQPDQPKSDTPPPLTPPPSEGTEGGDIGDAHRDEADRKTESAVENAVKRELRLPESIMALFTVAIFFAAVAQCSEMHSGGVDTHNLASATENLAGVASAQLEINNAAASAAASQAVSTREMALAASGQLNELRASVAEAKEAADAAKQLATTAQNQVHVAKDTLLAANRAWIAPTSVAISKITEKDPFGHQQYAANIGYTNTGHSPALGVVKTFSSISMKVENTFDLDHVFAGINRSCDGLEPPNAGNVVYPQSVMNSGFNFSFSPDTNLPKGESFFIQGCFAYKTMGRTHTSSFCVFTSPREETPIEQRKILFCADGNHAD